MITKKAGDLLLKIEFSLRVGNGRSRESSVCEDIIIEKTCSTYLQWQNEFTDEWDNIQRI